MPWQQTRIEIEPGREVYHVWYTEPNGQRVEHRYPYVVHGIAWDTRSGGWRVILEDASDGPDRGKLLIFTASTFANSFIPAQQDESVPVPAVPEPAVPEPPQKKIAGAFHRESGV
jgi:hypothetical protein